MSDPARFTVQFRLRSGGARTNGTCSAVLSLVGDLRPIQCLLVLDAGLGAWDDGVRHAVKRVPFAWKRAGGRGISVP